MIDEERRREARDDAPQQPVRHRRAGEAELAAAREIGARESVVRQQIVIERRHEIEVRHPLARDEVERLAGIEAALAHEAAIDERHGEERAHAHRVIERHDAERALAPRVEILRDMRDAPRRARRGGGAARPWAARSCPRCRA